MTPGNLEAEVMRLRREVDNIKCRLGIVAPAPHTGERRVCGAAACYLLCGKVCARPAGHHERLVHRCEDHRPGWELTESIAKPDPAHSTCSFGCGATLKPGATHFCKPDPALPLCLVFGCSKPVRWEGASHCANHIGNSEPGRRGSTTRGDACADCGGIGHFGGSSEIEQADCEHCNGTGRSPGAAK